MQSDEEPGSRHVALLIAVTFAFPIFLTVLYLPTPSVDVREHVNWGLYFPLYTWKHPPFEDWVAGAIALTGAREGWAYAMAAQIFTLGALGYLGLIARRFIGRETVLPVLIAFCGTIFSSTAIPVSAINADQLQVVMWLGLLYHGLRALQGDRWRDWILSGLFAALAILTKYFAAVFVVAFLISAGTGPWRHDVWRPGFAVATAVCLGLLAIHAGPLLIHMSGNGHMVQYGASQFNFHASLSERLYSLSRLSWSFIVFGLPFLIVLAVLVWRGDVGSAKDRRNPGFTIIVTTLALVLAALTALIFAAGLMYRQRFSNPVMPLILLALFGCIRVSPAGTRRFAGGVLIFYLIMVVGSAVLLTGLGDNYLRDPLAAATERIRQDWNSHYSCGPAYVIGGNETGNAPGAQGVGMYYGGSVRGLSDYDYRFAQWVDRDSLSDLGAIIVETPRSLTRSSTAALFPDTTSQVELRLPFRRVFGGQTQTYFYRFVAPSRCPKKS